MAEDKDGQLWFGTENGASRYDNKTFTNYTTRDGLCGNYINAIIQDKTGKLWFGSDGISCYKNKRFTNFTKKDGSAFKRITALYEDQSGNIWIGTFNGLSRYDGTNFTDFLSKFLTYYIIGDKQGNMWLTHSEPNTHYSDIANQLIYKYDGKEFTKIIEKYEPNDFQIFGKTADKDGNIWFGTMHGPCRYNVNSSRGQKNTFSYFSDPLK
jgi:ligand-binding sensor domain-containing protein